MFNHCFYYEGCICFDEHEPGEETDYLYVYSPEKNEWLAYHEKYERREFNGQTKIVVKKDGEDIIIF